MTKKKKKNIIIKRGRGVIKSFYSFIYVVE